MVLESTIVCVDNSNYMRNGDYYPNRLTAEIDAVNLICNTKTRSNPENNVGLVTMSNGRVIVTLTQEVFKISANLSKLQPDGQINFETGIRVAHLALKHRQGRNHKQRIIVFIGSPVPEDATELVKIAKRLKKEKVNVDFICFGQEGDNIPKLELFVQTLNGKDGVGSHLLVIPPGTQITEALTTSIILQGEDGTGGLTGTGNDPFGMDSQEDPELAMALRVSMEEQRAREGGLSSATDNTAPGGRTGGTQEVFAHVAQEGATLAGQGRNDVHAMTEDEQLAHAIRLSITEPPAAKGRDEPMDTDEPAPK